MPAEAAADTRLAGGPGSLRADSDLIWYGDSA
jgi:hypothetical protein